MTWNAKFTHNLVKRQCAEVEVGRCGMRREFNLKKIKNKKSHR